jgi:hypothetical protein
MLPIITMTELQRSTKDAIASIHDYAVIQNHGRDVGFLLHPDLGRVLLESGMLRQLIERAGKAGKGRIDMKKLDALIGNVVLELSKR